VELDDDVEPRSTCPVCEGPLTYYPTACIRSALCENDGMYSGGKARRGDDVRHVYGPRSELGVAFPRP